MRTRLPVLGLALTLSLAAVPETSLAAGCPEFGAGVVELVRANHPFGQFIRDFVPVNEEVATLKTVFCPAVQP